jgi:hypothetical protein
MNLRCGSKFIKLLKILFFLVFAQVKNNLNKLIIFSQQKHLFAKMNHKKLQIFFLNSNL